MDIFASVVSCIAAFLGLLGAYVGYKTAKLSVGSRRKGKEQARYDFAKEFLGDDRWENLHDYLLESGYLALSGQQFDASLIRYFLMRKKPYSQMADFARGSRFLQPIEDDKLAVSSITFKKSLNSKVRYRIRVGVVSFFYFVCAFAVVAPLFPYSSNLPAQFMLKNVKGVVVYAVSSFSFLILTVFFLLELRELFSAKRVLENIAAEDSLEKSSVLDENTNVEEQPTENSKSS